MKYQDLKAGIRSHLEDAAEDFFMVGYFLRQISENALFTEDGYKSIWEFAKGEYGLSTSSASRFMAINARFSIDGGEHMAEKYIGMGVSKLQEMLGLPDEELEKVTQETTVREIRAMKKKQEAPRSFYSFPKTERPEGSLLTTPGCGDGKYDCFSCCRECAIRQEPRQCRTAPLGNPFPCTRVNNEEWKKNIAYSLYKDECQLLHPELAPVREGDKEPDPCCLNCTNKTCFNRCDVAKKKDEDEKKQAQEELRKQQREAEAKRPEPSDRDIKAFYDWAGIKTTDNITAEDLKKRYKNAGGGGGRGAALQDYTGSARGIRINHKKELTWVQIAKRIKEIQEAEKKKADFVERSNGAQKNVRDLIKQQEEKRRIEAEEKKAARAAAKLQAEAEEPGKPEIIDGDFREVEDEPMDDPAQEAAKTRDERQEPEPVLCDTCEHEGECAGKKTHENGCMGYEEKAQELEAEAEPNPEEYSRFDVADILKRESAYLKDGGEAGAPAKFIRNHKILVDALTLLLEKMDAEGGAED